MSQSFTPPVSLKWVLLPAIIFLLALRLQAQSLTEVPTVLSGWNSDDIEFVDIDNDGDLDIYLNGEDTLGNLTSTFFINDNLAGAFTELVSPIIPLNSESHSFGDINNDGWLDFFQTGENDNGDNKSYLYVNSSGSFTILDSSIAGVRKGTSTFGDVDNDGDLDLVISGTAFNSGTSSNEASTKLYINQGGAFSLASQYFAPRFFPSSKMLDYDLDGDLDYFSSGTDSVGAALEAQIYSNQGGSFSLDAGTMLPTFVNNASEWADFDNDGDMDVAISGSFQTTVSAKIYANNGGIFAPTSDSLLPLRFGNIQWGDLNNDGYSELTLCGSDISSADSTQIYVQNSTNNTFQGFPFPPSFGVDANQIKLGDFDNNGALDALQIGGAATKLFSNGPAVSNTAPTAPTISALYTINPDSSITISWSGATDTETPTPGLSYSLWIGTSANGMEITAPPADTATGYRRIVEFGQVKTTSWTLNGLDCGTEYWFRVQAVDAGYMGSAFSAPLHVVLQPTVTAIASGGSSVVATLGGAPADSIQWYDASGAPILGENSTVYTTAVPVDTMLTLSIQVWSGFCSATLPATQYGFVGVKNAINASSVKVWPNPTNSEINVKVENPLAIEAIQIFDMQGRLMRSLNQGFTTETSIEVSGLTAGLYMVKMTRKNGRGISTATFRKD